MTAQWTEEDDRIGTIVSIIDRMHIPIPDSCYDRGKEPRVTDDMWFSIGRFLKKLPIEEVQDAMEIACTKKRYYATSPTRTSTRQSISTCRCCNIGNGYTATAKHYAAAPKTTVGNARDTLSTKRAAAL